MSSLRAKFFLLTVLFSIEVIGMYDSLMQDNETIMPYHLIQLDEITTPNPSAVSGEEYNEYYEQIQEQEKHYQDILNAAKLSQEDVNYKFSSSEEDVTQRSSHTTTVPDYIQMFADMKKDEEGYSMENDSRLYETNETASFSMKNNIYAEKDADLSKNTSEDNQMMDSYGDDIDQIEAGTTTLTAPIIRKKQGKQIPIIKLLPHEALRNYIEDAYIRTPLAAIVDTSTNSLDKIKSLWKDALRPNAALDIVLLAFNSSGVAVTYHLQNTRTFLAGLESLKEDSTGNAFHAIIKASKLVPYDSALFLSTASLPTDSNLARIAATTLLKKRIRLYLIWFGEKCYSENETQEITGGILGEVAIRSGGEILHVDNNQSAEFEGNMLTLISENYKGPQQVQIPVDTTMSNLHIKIDGAMQTTTLETPSGDIWVKAFRRAFFTLDKENGNAKGKLEADIPLKHIHQNAKFLLRIIPKQFTQPYYLSVKASQRSGLSNTEMFDNTLESMNLVDVFDGKTIEEERKEYSHENIRFPSENQNESNFSLIFPTDQKIAKQVATLLPAITKIDIGIQSQLLVAPGMMSQIYFEISNLRNEPVAHSIQVTDERSFLQSLNPQRVFLSPGQTITAFVAVIVPPSVAQGTTDRITFTCLGNGQTSQSLLLKVLSGTEPIDTTPPTLTWTFGSRCDGQYQTSCTDRNWNLDIVGQDWGSGILRLQSSPNRIFARSDFTVGTTDAVRVAYTANCCQPRVTLTAYDLAGNQKSVTIDVRDVVLTEASIAAIALGVLLLILLIIIVIGLIVWCFRKRRDSRDLSSFRSHPERTR